MQHSYPEHLHAPYTWNALKNDSRTHIYRYIMLMFLNNTFMSAVLMDEKYIAAIRPVYTGLQTILRRDTPTT